VDAWIFAPVQLALGYTQAHAKWVPIFYCWVNRPGRDVDHSKPSRAEVKERIELNFCTSSVTLWYNIGELYIYPKY